MVRVVEAPLYALYHGHFMLYVTIRQGKIRHLAAIMAHSMRRIGLITWQYAPLGLITWQA